MYTILILIFFRILASNLKGNKKIERNLLNYSENVFAKDFGVSPS